MLKKCLETIGLDKLRLDVIRNKIPFYTSLCKTPK